MARDFLKRRQVRIVPTLVVCGIVLTSIFGGVDAYSSMRTPARVSETLGGSSRAASNPPAAVETSTESYEPGIDSGSVDPVDTSAPGDEIVNVEDQFVGVFSVPASTDFYLSSSEGAPVADRLKSDQTFKVIGVTPNYFRVKLSNGRLGFILRSVRIRSVRATTEESKKLSKPQSVSTGANPSKPTPPLPPERPVVKAPVVHIRPPKESSGEIRHAGQSLATSATVTRNERPVRIHPPVDRELPSERNLPSYEKGARLIERLIASAKRQPYVCRVPATHLQKRLGHQCIRTNRAKGKCYSAVKDALIAAGIMKKRNSDIPAVSAHTYGTLRKLGFKNIFDKVKREAHTSDLKEIAKHAPVGTILVYAGGKQKFGHIEIKAGVRDYCSDYCKSIPGNNYMRRTLVAIYQM